MLDTCGAHIEYPRFTCPACTTVEEIQALRKESAANLGELAEVQRRGFEALSEGLSEIASVIEWGFEEVNWRLQQQTAVLQSIDHTLKTPSQTQGNEWRQMAEELRSRGVLDKSEEFFLKSLKANPLDYRTYVGLAEAYLQMDRFDEAKTYLEESLLHAPKGTSKRAVGRGIIEEVEKYRPFGLWSDEVRQQLLEYSKQAGHKPPELMSDEDWVLLRAEYLVREREREKIAEQFDYKSYSYRLIGHIYACGEDYPAAVSALRSAVELTPAYYQAIYDLAQCSAQVRDKGTCLSSLKTVIDADIFYFYLAQKERNFEPLSSGVGNLLKEISTDASDRAKAEISKAEEMIRAAEESIAKAHEALRKCRTKEKLIAPSITLLEDAKPKLRLAKDKMAMEDYRASLDAIPVGKEAYGFATKAKNQADEIPEYYRNERSERLKEALLFPLWGIPLFTIGFGLLGYLGGCAIGLGGLIEGFIEGGVILGAIVGLIIGIGFTVSGLRDVKNVKR